MTIQEMVVDRQAIKYPSKKKIGTEEQNMNMKGDSWETSLSCTRLVMAANHCDDYDDDSTNVDEDET